MSSWSKAAASGLIGFMMLNIAGTVYYFILKRQLANTREPPIVAIESKFPAFSGVDIAGVEWKATAAPCRVIRITDDDCKYCKKDKTSYAKIIEAALSASCEVIELSPRAGRLTADARSGIVQLKFVDTDLGNLLAPFATPQTLILDGTWTLKFNRRGAFDEIALADGMAALNSFPKADIDNGSR